MSIGAVSLITWAGCSRNVSCLDYMGPPLVMSLDWYWPISVWDQPSAWLTVRINPNHCMWTAVQVLTMGSRICFRRVWYQLRSPFDKLLVKLIASYSDVVWSWPLGVLVLSLLGETLLPAIVRHCLWLALSRLFDSVSMWLLLSVLGYRNFSSASLRLAIQDYCSIIEL